jgi:hypothetical protein
MPLVTRFATAGQLFKEALEPGAWLDGDLWSDTTANEVKVNVAGTATAIGSTSFSSSATVTYSETIGNYTTPDSATATSASGTTEFKNMMGGTTSVGMTATTVRGFGNHLQTGHALIGKVVTTLTVSLKDAMTGTATFGVWDEATDTLQFTFGTLDCTTLTASFADYTETNATGYTLVDGDIIGVFISGSGTETNLERYNVEHDSLLSGFYPSDGQAWSNAGDTQQLNMIVSGAATGSKAVDGSTSTTWISDAETNPAIYVDMGASVNTVGMALYASSSNAETEFQIRVSTDASFAAGEAVRTITVSNLTNGQYNYIRWNVAVGRYVQVYGNGGASNIMAITEIAVYKRTDAEILADLGILTISPTDTSLALDGT